MPRVKRELTDIAPPATSGAIIISEKTSVGDNCYLEPTSAGTAAMIPTEGRSFTWAFWGNFTTPVARSIIQFLAVFNSSNQKKIEIKYQKNINKRFYVQFLDGSTGQRQLKRDNFDTEFLDGWHHFAMTWNGETNNFDQNFKLYLDGNQLTLTNMSGAATDLDDLSGGEMVFFSDSRSASSVSAADPENAIIDEMVWFNAELSAEQISELYNDRKTFNPLTRHSQKADLKGWWTFDTDKLTVNQNSVTASDSSGNGYTLFNHDYGFDGVNDKSFNSGSAYPFLDDQIETTTLRSGLMSETERRLIRELDNLGNHYPTLHKTGDPNRKGNFFNFFDDGDTIIFNSNVQLNYPTLTPANSKNLLMTSSNFYAGPNEDTNTINALGTMKSGITDNVMHRYSSEKQDVFLSEFNENMKPYDDSRVYLGDTEFFLTGSDLQVIPGFSSRLHDKTQIVFTLNNSREEFLTKSPKVRNDVLDPAGEFAGQNKTGFVYYNWDLQRWDQIGLIDPFDGSSIHFDFAVEVDRTTNKFVSGTNNFPSQFYATPQNDRKYEFKVESNETWPNAGYPHINSFAPLGLKYHATASQTLNLSSYLSAPFLLEKVLVEFPYIQRRSHIGNGDSNTSGTKSLGQMMHQDDYVFFIYRQDRTGAQQLVDSEIDVSGSNRFLVLSGCMSFYNSKVYDVSDASYELNNKPLNTPAFEIDHGITATTNDQESVLTGSAILQLKPAVVTKQFLGGGRIPSSSLTLRAGEEESNEVNIPQYYWPGGTSYRNFGETQYTGRSFETQVGTYGGGFNGTASGNRLFDEYSLTSFKDTASNLADINVFDPRIRASGGKIESLRSSNQAIVTGEKQKFTPYILLPTDRLIFGIDNPQVLHHNQKMLHSNELTSSFLKLRTDKPMKVTFFGSLIKNKQEFHDTLNQHLTTLGVHEAIHYDNPVLDQFNISSRFEYSGSYLDDYVTGSVGSLVRSSVGDGLGLISKSFQRFVAHSNFEQRYYDTLTPSIIDIATVDNVPFLQTGDSFRRIHAFSGTFASSADNDINHKFWNYIFPFEPRYHNLKRIVSERAFIYNFGQERSHTATPTNEYSILPSPVSRRGPDMPQDFHALNSRFLAFGFGSGHNGNSYRLSDRTVNALNRRWENPRGFKYGLYCSAPLYKKAIFRSDKFGQFSDFLEQGKDTRYYISKNSVVTDSPVRVRFLLDDDENDQFIILSPSEIETNTEESSNLSLYATSSLPFFDTDNVTRNRTYLTSSLIIT